MQEVTHLEKLRVQEQRWLREYQSAKRQPTIRKLLDLGCEVGQREHEVTQNRQVLQGPCCRCLCLSPSQTTERQVVPRTTATQEQRHLMSSALKHCTPNSRIQMARSAHEGITGKPNSERRQRTAVERERQNTMQRKETQKSVTQFMNNLWTGKPTS